MKRRSKTSKIAKSVKRQFEPKYKQQTLTQIEIFPPAATRQISPENAKKKTTNQLLKNPFEDMSCSQQVLETASIKSVEPVASTTSNIEEQASEQFENEVTNMEQEFNSITEFNFNDFVPGNMNEVVVNPEGDTIDIIAPSVTYLPTPREGTS